jgi:tRNA(fMet)-specific endonuclease VapC
MIYLLDTNVCARYLNGKSLTIRQRLRSTKLTDIAVCSVVKGELFYGAMKSNNLEKTLARQQDFLKLFISLPFDDDASLIYGRIRAELSSKGIMIGSNDLQIAAIAMANNLILVTHNVKKFSRVNGLQFEDWEV